MNEQAPVSAVSTLVIPQGDLQIVLPGALIAQVMNGIGEIVPLPGTEDWMLGLTAWRSLAVPVISLETLLAGKSSDRSARGRLIVCYRLPGRPASEFFALSVPSGVHTYSVDAAAGRAAVPPGVRTDLIAGALTLSDGSVGVIPDLNKLSEIFYKS